MRARALTLLPSSHGRYGGEQLCWMNTSLVEHLIVRVRALLRRSPAARLVSVSQNDNSKPCTRPADQAVIDEEGSAAAPMLRAVNAIAANVSRGARHDATRARFAALRHHATLGVLVVLLCRQRINFFSCILDKCI